MRLKPVKPASGLAIRNAFQYAMMDMVDGDQYASTHHKNHGELLFAFSAGTDIPTSSCARGDSVLLESDPVRLLRLSLVPLHDTVLYDEFEILAEGFGKNDEPELFRLFAPQLTRLATLMNRRLASWVKVTSDAAA